jgi:hypothetical protein
VIVNDLKVSPGQYLVIDAVLNGNRIPCFQCVALLSGMWTKLIENFFPSADNVKLVFPSSCVDSMGFTLKLL